MSPEDVFASQMWPWPDPALKRDSMGRVLFVNAAFLQMYGGTIDDWRGNVVTGWPAPQAPGVPYRFETSMPSAEGEQIFDWMEFTLADGNAFAMARNVTYIFQMAAPQPSAEAEPHVAVSEPAEQMVAAQTPETQMPAAPTSEAVPAAEAPQTYAAEPEAPAFEAQAPQATSVDETADDIHAQAMGDAAFDSATYDQAINPPVETETADAQTYSAAPEIEAPQYESAAVEAEAPERDFERRALPLENESSVLGNNWRDVVIAKAVGASAPSEESVEEEDSVMAQPSSDGNSGPVRVLLAEDNAINALLTRTLLEAEGHIVDTVEDGALAVEAMKTSTYDLILMDMRMPNMDGLESTRKIRALDNVSKGLPIIALTANAFDDDRNACFDSGMNDFMTKPVSAEELSEMVRTWTKNLAERRAA